MFAKRMENNVEFHDFSILDGESPRMTKFFTVWDSKRAGKDIPLLRDMKILELGEVAAYCTLTQRISRTKTVYRYCGSQIDRVYANSLTGKDICDIVKPEIAKRLVKASNFVMDLPCGALICETVTFESGSQAKATTLTLPVAETKGICNNMFSYVEYVGIDAPIEMPGVINQAAYRDLIFSRYIRL